MFEVLQGWRNRKKLPGLAVAVATTLWPSRNTVAGDGRIFDRSHHHSVRTPPLSLVGHADGVEGSVLAVIKGDGKAS